MSNKTFSDRCHFCTGRFWAKGDRVLHSVPPCDTFSDGQKNFKVKLLKVAVALAKQIKRDSRPK